MGSFIYDSVRIYNFRRFKSTNDSPGLQITFHKGLNALVGENDSGKTAIIDALKLVLLTQSNEYIRPVDEDFYKPIDGEACSEFKIECTITDFSSNDAKNFVEYLRDGNSKKLILDHYLLYRHNLVLRH